ncbi:LysM peptidoglycan-binding domain-containing protein [Peribacillus muralis]|uniref:glucosaminidase domain-containing protein n=1 Tax=Peribacillus muralis TaxID=264697 RepID=UPI001F4EB4BC|nr:glucosaminidase domain-containing protein [Peribacillus muralis]MCK1993840.1 glucosaminidase domain-containing protein [Peribacillus muralis]MCK2013871.1 glucosaminidase domain-containing protein [Peribacillus muralis]
MSKETFINEIAPYALRIYEEFKILPSVIIAQACLESGYGTSALAKQGKNIFGTKGDYKGESIIFQTIEYVNGAPVQVRNKFRKYPTWEESLRDLANLYAFGTSWNRNLYSFVIGEKDYKKAVKAIFDAGYATDPKYTEKLVNLIETSGLTKYDVMTEEVYHIVKKGDTVSALAKGYGSTQVQIQQWNGLADLNLIKVNQRLRVK